MPYNSNRVERISEEVTKELAMLLRDVKDPRVSQTMLSVVRCEVTNDMRWCKVFLSALGDCDYKELKRGLKSCSGFLRRELAHRLRLRYTPESTAPGPAKHPVFRIENGEIGVFDLTAGNRLTVDALLQVFREPRATGRPAPSRVVVHYADRSPAVEYLLTRLSELYPSATVYERPITLSIQVNLGRDIVGVVGD